MHEAVFKNVAALSEDSQKQIQKINEEARTSTEKIKERVLKEVGQVLEKSIKQQGEPGIADVVEAPVQEIVNNVVAAPAKKRFDITNLRRLFATQNAQIDRLKPTS
jgi:hypothetical protein